MTTSGTPGPELTVDGVRSAMPYVDTWLDFQRTYLRVPGVQVAVLIDGEVVLSNAYGLADVEGQVALTSQHLFRVASHSKTFTATAVLQLVEAGRLRLDDPVGRWLPFLEAPASALGGVTVRELLSHAGGVIRDGREADYWQLLHDFPDEATLRAIALDDAAVQPANVRFKYSNIGYSLLGLVIEAAAGTPYNEHVTTEIVDRLGLVRTGPELDPARAEEYAAGYTALAYAEGRRPLPHVDTRAMASATGFYSTAEELCRYAAAHFYGDDRLLSDASKRVLQHEAWSVEGRRAGAYGLGFMLAKAGDRRLVGHGGGYPGHITRLVFDPEARLAVAVLTNAVDGPAEALALSVVRIIDKAASASVDSGSERSIDRFCGRFANLWGVSDVGALGGRLHLMDPTGPEPTEGCALLAVEDDTTLRVLEGDGYGAVGELMTYDFDAAGRVTSVKGPGGLTSWPLADYQARTT